MDLKFKQKIQMSQNNDIIEDIKRNLTERVNAGQITTEQLKETFPNTEVELLLLSPAFITQGGPDCIAVQVIKR